MKHAFGAIGRCIKAHPVLIVAYPVDLALGIAFMLSISTGSAAWVQASFAGLVVLIVTVKLSLAAERTVIGNMLCSVAVLLNAFATVSFFVTHTAPHAIVRETVQIVGLKAEVRKWDTILENGRQDIKAKLDPKVNQRTVVDTILSPQLAKDQIERDRAQARLDQAIKDELDHVPDAIEVFERPFRLLEEPSLGRVALMIFALGASLFLEGVMWRSMRRRHRPVQSVETTETEGPPVQSESLQQKVLTKQTVYPRQRDGSLKSPAEASVVLQVPFAEALRLYEREKEG